MILGDKYFYCQNFLFFHCS